MQGEGAGFSGRSLFCGTDQTPRLLAAWGFLISFHTWWKDSEKRIWWFVLRPGLGLTSGFKVTCLPLAYFKHQGEVSLKAPFMSEFLHLWSLPAVLSSGSILPSAGRLRMETRCPRAAWVASVPIQSVWTSEIRFSLKSLSALATLSRAPSDCSSCLHMI